MTSGCKAGSAGVGGSGGSTSSAKQASSGSLFMTGSGGEGGNGPTCTPGGPDDDVDQDGFTPSMGDCDDCEPNRNPNAIEVPTPMGKAAFDEDCDTLVDEDDSVLCDEALAIDTNDPVDAARSIELCKASTGPEDWGLVAATWVLADGSPPPTDPSTRQKFDLGHGMLTAFGPNVSVRKGASMLALSSGAARALDDPGYQDPNGVDKNYTSGHPDGFPKESPSCPGTLTGVPHDAVALELLINTPSNAKGLSFDFDFYTFEWPVFVCSSFNDFFVALLSPKPPGQSDENISFDSKGNPVSVNNALLGVCGCEGNPPAACIAKGKQFDCPLGNIELIGTGFGFDTDQNGEDHGATSWLRTAAPVAGGKPIRLRLAVYDSGDGGLASTTLIDNFQWIATPGTKVSTAPVPK